MAGMDMLVSALLNAAGVDLVKVKEIASKLADDETVNKLLAFANGLETINLRLANIEIALKLGTFDGTEFEPDPDAGLPNSSRIADSRFIAMSEQSGAD